MCTPGAPLTTGFDRGVAARYSGLVKALAVLSSCLLSCCAVAHSASAPSTRSVAERSDKTAPFGPSPGSERPAQPADVFVSTFDASEPLVGVDAARTRAASHRLRTTLAQLAATPRFALGHEDTLAYGVGWQNEPDRSDVASVCGAHAAVHGWDVFGIEHGDAHNGDGVAFETMRNAIQQAYSSGAIITLSWHAHNPLTQGNAWETGPVVEHILPGRSRHADFRRYLDRVGNFLHSLRGPNRELIPVIFRPFHEHTGNWFWWGRAHVSEADFQELWRFTVDYLREERGLSHLLFAFSPSGFDIRDAQTYFYAYPGDEYVDVLGFDHYYRDDAAALVAVSELVVQLAKQRNKVPAITEFGVQGGLNHPAAGKDWINERFLEPLVASSSALGIAYALAWRNARQEHAFLPYPEHPDAAGFARFCKSPRVVLLDDMTRPGAH